MKALVLALLLQHAHGIVQLDRAIDEYEFRNPGIDPEENLLVPIEMPPQAAERAEEALENLNAFGGTVDARTARFDTVSSSNPFAPGTGNDLTYLAEPPSSLDEYGEEVFRAFIDFMTVHQDDFNIDPAELLANPRVTVHSKGESVHIYCPRKYDGLDVIDSYFTCTVQNGNAVLFGTQKWSNINVATDLTSITEQEALEEVQEYLGPQFTVSGTWQASESKVLLMGNSLRRRGRRRVQSVFGNGYRSVNVLQVYPIIEEYADSGSTFMAMVDSRTGELLAFDDQTDFLFDAEFVAGVFPVSNDGEEPDGVEQERYPLPYLDVTLSGSTSGTRTTDSEGNILNLPDGATLTASLSGTYVTMDDQCGASSLSTVGFGTELDFSISEGTDCATPAGEDLYGGAGNTHSSRSGFYELNRIKEQARAQLPQNTWLRTQLRAIMNINSSCNAFWSGAGYVGFYRSGSCGNTGELAAVFDHEFGHGMDANDALGGISRPSGEGIADVYAALRLATSCIGRGFYSNNCGGNGDPCLDCSGVRDIDYLKRQSRSPHTFTWANANCGNSVHCLGGTYSEAIWSLWKRDLPNLYGMDDYSAHELVTYLTYKAAGNVDIWFAGSPGSGGCSSNNGYPQFLAADDVDGNVDNGTPHMRAIYNAFNRQQIACPTPSRQDRGCEEVALFQNQQPVVTATASNRQVRLTWTRVPNDITYQIFRTDGVFGCNFGKIKIGETGGTSFTDSGLLNGREYYYVVIPKGNNEPCFGRSSECVAATPLLQPRLVQTGCTVVDFETGRQGWVSTGSCRTGQFVIGTPSFVENSGTVTQVGGDHTTGVGNALYTRPNESAGNMDVDGGSCQVTSPRYDISGSGSVSLFYFLGQRDAADDINGDFGSIELSINDGASWTSLVSFFDVTDNAAWIQIQRGNIPDNSAVRLRMTVSDGANDGDLLEGGLDDVLICSVDTPRPTEPPSPAPSATPSDTPSATPTRTPTPTESPTASPTRTPTVCTTEEDFENGSGGWQNDPASTCQTGEFIVAYPTGWGTSSVTTQVEGDHTFGPGGGGNALFTEENDSIGNDDVDVGFCSVLSPAYTVPGDSDDYFLTLWYFFGQRDNNDDDDGDDGDFFRLEISEDNGATWTTLVFIGDVTNQAIWTEVRQPVCRGCIVRLRVTASDANSGDSGDIIEAGIDDVSICKTGTLIPTPSPTQPPTPSPTSSPTNSPVPNPTFSPTSSPTPNPTFSPTSSPTVRPTVESACLVIDFEDGNEGSWVYDEVGSTCSTGRFIVGTPNEMTSSNATGNIITQVGGDNTPGRDGGGNALYTAINAITGSVFDIGTDDVDGGFCRVFLGPYTVTQASTINFVYFHGQRDEGDEVGANEDYMTVDISYNNGVTYKPLVNRGDETSVAEWTAVSDEIPAGSTVLLRMEVSDGPTEGDIVEGGIDDIVICPDCLTTVDFEDGGFAGWTNDPTSSCTKGTFVVGRPSFQRGSGNISNNTRNITTQPDGDNTFGGAPGFGNALYTANNTSIGVDDVDGGECVVVSPQYTVGVPATLYFHYFHGQRDGGDDPNGDWMYIDISFDNFASSTRLVDIRDVETNATWTEVTRNLNAGSTFRLRVSVSDGTEDGDIIEGGIDDIRICPRPPA